MVVCTESKCRSSLMLELDGNTVCASCGVVQSTYRLDDRAPFVDPEDTGGYRLGPAETAIDELHPTSTTVSNPPEHEKMCRNSYLQTLRRVNTSHHGCTKSYQTGLSALAETMRAFDFSPLMASHTKRLWLDFCKLKMKDSAAPDDPGHATMSIPKSYRSVLNNKHHSVLACEVPSLVLCQIRHFNLMHDVRDVALVSSVQLDQGLCSESKIHKAALHMQTILVLPDDCPFRIGLCGATAILNRLSRSDSELNRDLDRLAVLVQLLAVAAESDPDLVTAADTYTLAAALAFVACDSVDRSRALTLGSSYHRRLVRSRDSAEPVTSSGKRRSASLLDERTVDPLTGKWVTSKSFVPARTITVRKVTRADVVSAAGYPLSFPRWRHHVTTIWSLYSVFTTGLKQPARKRSRLLPGHNQP
jgi:hypothetical protein